MKERRIKVVHLITLLEMGGAQGNTIFTVENLNPERFDAHLWTGPGAILDDKVILALPAERLRFFHNLVRPINPLKDFLAIFDLARALKRSKPDILHTHSSKAGILGRLAGRLAGVPVVIHTFHGFGFNQEQPKWIRGFYIFLEKLCAKFSRALIFVSESNRKEAGEEKIGVPSQYHLIRSGIDLPVLRDQAKQTDILSLKDKLRIPREARVVSTIGPFKPQKNLVDFIRMARLVYEAVPESIFIMVGDGKLRPSLEKEVEAQNMKGKILMVGWRSDIPELLSLTDVFVLTSLWEGLPRAMVEALALRIPCVCYDTDGVRDLLRIGGGSLVTSKTPESAAREVSAFLTGRKKAEFSPELKEKIDAEFDIRAMVHRQESLYRKLI